MENLQPKLKRAVRVSQEESQGILARKRTELKATAVDTIMRDGQNGISIGVKYNQTVRKPFGSRGLF